MTNLRALFFDSPELWRNLRIELSPKRLITTGIITAIFALIVIPSLVPHAFSVSDTEDSNAYLSMVFWIQKVTLPLGGAISCWRAVRRERELNTYDFQRITRLSPLELAVGKLFGGPALAYFVTLCFVPPALFSAATTSPAALVTLLQGYLLLFTSSLVIHSFALMISTISDKGGAMGSVVLILIMQVFPVVGWLFVMGARGVSQTALLGPPTLAFYGIAFPPILLWAILALGFTAWLLLAIVRNIKVDLDAMQLFTVHQGLGFAAYCNFVWVGFYPWKAGWGGNSAGPLLFLGVVFFYGVAIGALQSRELVRRGLRETKAALSESLTLLGPIGLLALGAILTEFVIIMLGEQHRLGDPTTSFVHDLFLALYFAAWLARDLFYLQWMKVRPVRSPLRKAFLYLGVFYLSTSIVFRTGLTSPMADTAAFAAWLAPFPLLRNWTEAQWNATSGMWLMALGAQLGAAAVFAYLYQQQVDGLSRQPKTAPPTAPARPSPTQA